METKWNHRKITNSKESRKQPKTTDITNTKKTNGIIDFNTMLTVNNVKCKRSKLGLTN